MSSLKAFSGFILVLCTVVLFVLLLLSPSAFLEGIFFSGVLSGLFGVLDGLFSEYSWLAFGLVGLMLIVFLSLVYARSRTVTRVTGVDS